MMCRAPAFFLCLVSLTLLRNSVLATRLVLHQKEQPQARAAQLLRGGALVTQKCIFNEPMPLDCDEGEELNIVTAFWRRTEQGACVKPEHTPKSTTPACHANATGQVIQQCSGYQRCVLPMGFIGCPENPFTFLRVRFKCQPLHPAKKFPEISEDHFSPDSNELQTAVPADQVTQGPEARKMVSLVQPSRLSNDECNNLVVGAFGCEVKQKEDGQTSSPLLLGDYVCQCQYIGFTPKTCDALFSSDDSVFTVQRQETSIYKPAVFGKEGCDCYEKGKGLSMCDLALREVQV